MAKEEIDLNNGGDEPSSGDGQTGGEEEKVSISKTEWDKINRDLNNYREGLLQKKAEERTIEKKDEIKSPDIKIDINEEKIQEITNKAQAGTISLLEKENERLAIKSFLRDHPEYTDDTEWGQLISNYSPRHGKLSPQGILDDFENAVLLHKKETGKLDSYLQSYREKGRQEGAIEQRISSGYNAGGTGERGAGSSGEQKVSARSIEMAKNMHIDPKSLEVNNDQQSVIDVTQRRK